MLSSKDILGQTDIGSVKTLTRWHQRGLIPPPEIRTHPNGKGKLAYWPSWVVFRIKEVRKLLTSGDSLDEIAVSLGSDWDAEAQRWSRKRRDVKKALENARHSKVIEVFAESAAEKIYEYLRTLGIKRPGIYNQLEDDLSASRFVDQGLKLFREGLEPIAVFDEGNLKVMTEADLVKSLTKEHSEPILLLPIGRLLRKAFKEIEKHLAEADQSGDTERAN